MLYLTITVNVDIITLNENLFLKFTIFSRKRRASQCNCFGRDELYNYCKFNSGSKIMNKLLWMILLIVVLLFYAIGKIKITLHITIMNKL